MAKCGTKKGGKGGQEEMIKINIQFFGGRGGGGSGGARGGGRTSLPPM